MEAYRPRPSPARPTAVALLFHMFTRHRNAVSRYDSRARQEVKPYRQKIAGAAEFALTEACLGHVITCPNPGPRHPAPRHVETPHGAIRYHHPLAAAAAETDRHRQLPPDLLTWRGCESP